MTTKKTIKSRLHILMGERKIKSINELSKQTGISNPTLNRLYNDQNDRIDYKTMITLCDFFHVSLDQLLELVEEEDKPKPRRRTA